MGRARLGLGWGELCGDFVVLLFGWLVYLCDHVSVCLQDKSVLVNVTGSFCSWGVRSSTYIMYSVAYICKLVFLS